MMVNHQVSGRKCVQKYFDLEFLNLGKIVRPLKNPPSKQGIVPHDENCPIRLLNNLSAQHQRHVHEYEARKASYALLVPFVCFRSQAVAVAVVFLSP